MVNLQRTLYQSVSSHLFKGKVIVLYGARRVGKTTLAKSILAEHGGAYFNADEPDVRASLANKTSVELKAYLGNKRLVVLDEAQRIENIGLTLKLLVDNFPDLQVIATGSSSFELSNVIIEPLTGRAFEFHLFPFSLGELKKFQSEQETHRTLEKRLLYGSYPEAVLQDDEGARATIMNIAQNYLFKDIFSFQDIRNPEVLEKLLQALALQVGHEVSYTELGETTGLDKNTVSQYIQLLEKAFIIFRLSPLSRNLRNELKRLRKIYFWDIGIRNAIINNFNPISLRQDVGALWENFCIAERLKFQANNGRHVNAYFWRTHTQQEIDYLEESGGWIRGFEFKWKPKAYAPPPVFTKAYPQARVSCVHRENFLEILNDDSS
ncbi:MAG: ATP-binding protein [bacterium]|nr:ATP-binding protein [bacterium]